MKLISLQYCARESSIVPIIYYVKNCTPLITKLILRSYYWSTTSVSNSDRQQAGSSSQEDGWHQLA